MKAETQNGREIVPASMDGADTVEQRVYRILMELVDEVALHDAPDFDPDAWRHLAQTFEDLIDEHFNASS